MGSNKGVLWPFLFIIYMVSLLERLTMIMEQFLMDFNGGYFPDMRPCWLQSNHSLSCSWHPIWPTYSPSLLAT